MNKTEIPTAQNPLEEIENLILTIRGKQVMLDRDLARLYGVETRVLNQAVKRNIERFPDDFMFQLTKEEFDNWKSQIVTSNWMSQNATSNSILKGARKCPYAFTENGIAMLSGLLNSSIAIRVNIQIMRAFVAMRHTILDKNQLFSRIENIEHNKQYSPVAVNIYTKAHDRFLIIDDKVYHVGASVKDLGKKLGAVSLLSCIDADEMIHKL